MFSSGSARRAGGLYIGTNRSIRDVVFPEASSSRNRTKTQKSSMYVSNSQLNFNGLRVSPRAVCATLRFGCLSGKLVRATRTWRLSRTQLLPPEADVFKYRIKNPREPHERVVERANCSNHCLPALRSPAPGAQAFPVARVSELQSVSSALRLSQRARRIARLLSCEATDHSHS